jgi:hypothetical protein
MPSLLNEIKKPEREPRTRLKYSLTDECRARLQAAAAYTGRDMSLILRELVMRYLPAPGTVETMKSLNEPFDLDEFREIDA